MLVMSFETNPMRTYRAIYRSETSREEHIDLMARSLASATLSVTELIGPNAVLVRIFAQGDW